MPSGLQEIERRHGGKILETLGIIPEATTLPEAAFRIVTGVGKHSKDGTLRIGPAVSKMLMREGWRAEVLAGEIIVRGKSKH